MFPQHQRCVIILLVRYRNHILKATMEELPWMKMYLLLQIVIFHVLVGQFTVHGSLWLSWQIIHKPGFPLLFANPFTDCWILPDVAFFLENLVINSTSTLRIFLFLCFRSFCDPILNGISRIFVVFFGLSRVTQIRAIKLDWSLTNALFGLVIYHTDHCWGRIHGDLAVGCLLPSDNLWTDICC